MTDPASRAVASRAGEALFPRDAMFMLSFFLPIAAWTGLLLWLHSRFFPTVPLFVFVLAAGLIVPPIFAPLMRRLASRGAPRAVDILARHGVCPSCAYDLVGLPVQPDGCLVCPECAGAWRAARITRTTPLADAAPAPGLDHVRRFAGAWFASLNRWKGRDDRGDPVELVSPRLRAEIRSATDDRLRDRLRLIRARVGTGRLLRWGVGGFFVVFSVGTSVLFSQMPVGPPTAAFIVPGLLGLAVLFGNFGFNKDRLIDTLKDENLCPGCASDLAPIEAGEDGCRECRVCGAAWRTSPAAVADEFAGTR